MRKSLGRALMIVFICRTSAAWLSTFLHLLLPLSTSSKSHLASRYQSQRVPFTIQNREVDVKEPQIGRLQLGFALVQNDSEIGNFAFCPWSKVQIVGVTEVEAHIGQNAIRPDYSTFFYLITLFAPTPFIRMNWFVKMKRAPHLHLEWIESWGLVVLWDKSWLRSCDELFHCGNGIGRFEINPRQRLTRSKRWRRATGTTWSGSCHNQEHGHMCGNVRWDEYTSFEKYQF